MNIHSDYSFNKNINYYQVNKNDKIKKIFQLGKEQLHAIFSEGQIANMSKAQRKLKKIELALGMLDKVHLVLTDQELSQLQTISQNLFNSDEMGKQEGGLLGYFRQFALEYQIGERALKQKAFQDSFASINQSLNALKIALENRPKLIK